MDAALAAARFLQFTSIALVFGLTAFSQYGVQPAVRSRHREWLRQFSLTGSGAAVAASILLLSAQGAEMAGAATAAFDPATLWAVVSETQFGHAWVVRFALLLGSVAVAWWRPQNDLVLVTVTAGAAVSLAWMGHGGEGGPVLGAMHRLADIFHILAASIWLGALILFGRLLRTADPDAAAALTGFAQAGTLLVATILVTGVINTIALVGMTDVAVIGSPYVVVLGVKVSLFLIMVIFAAGNRFLLAPRLAAGGAEAASAILRSVLAETLLAVLVLVVVAALGVLEPPNAA